MNIELESRAELESEFSQSSEKQDKHSKKSLLSLFRFSTNLEMALIVIGTVSSILMGFSIPIMAFLTGDIIDSFASQSDILGQGKRNMLLFTYFGIGTLILGAIMSVTWNVAAQRQAVTCRKQYFKSIVSQEVGWFDTHSETEIITSFISDTLTYEQAIGNKISTLIYLLSMLLSGIGISLYNGWIFTLVMIAYFPIVGCIWSKAVSIKHKMMKEHDQIYQESDKKAQQTLSALKLVKQMNAEDFQVSIQEKILAKVVKAYATISREFSTFEFLSVLVVYFAFTLTYWYGAECVFNSSKCPQSISTQPYTAGVVMKIFYALIIPAISMNQLTPSFEKIVEGITSFQKICDLIDRTPLIKSKENAIKPEYFDGVFKFVDVTFAYPKYKDVKVLNNFTLTINARNVGIIGPSGKGKSTIFQLIMRFYDPDQGAVFLDGVNLKDLDLEWLRDQIGYVKQEPVLFATSIKQNLFMAKADASEIEVQEALEKAEALNFVVDFTYNVETFVGTGGSQLSGGQKQRIAIARALLKNPRLILFDEATSALDQTNEKKILFTLKKMENSYNMISITHRKRVLDNCEVVYELQQDGSIHTTHKNIPSLEMSKKKSSFQTSSSQGSPLKNNFIQSRVSRIKFSQTKQKINIEEDINKKESQNEEQDKSEKDQLSLMPILCQLFMSNKCLFFLNIFLSLLSAIGFPTFGVYFAYAISYEIQYARNPEYYQSEIYKLCFIALGSSFVFSFIHAIAIWSGNLFGQKIIKGLRISVLVKLLNLPLSWFQKEENQFEKILLKLTANCKIIHSFFSLEFSTFTVLLATIIFSIAGALYFEWRTALSTLGMIPLIILSQVIQFTFINGFMAEKGKYYENASQILHESVMNIRTILSLGGTKEVFRRYEGKMDKILEVIFKKDFISGFLFGLSFLLSFVTFGLTLFMSIVFVSNNDIEISHSLSAVFLLVLACISAGSKATMLQEISNLKQAMLWVYEKLNMEDEYQYLQRQGSKRLKTPIKGNIEFKNVTFKYETRETLALDELSIKICEGEEVIFVGGSGCGKSTILSLLQGLYLPTQGQILIEGIDIKDYDLHYLRSCFCAVSQEPVLFNESIAWNIRYNLEGISQQDIYEAASKANFRPEIEKLNAGEQTGIVETEEIFERSNKAQAFEKNVGPKGSHVSGGQKQRIAIARAILRKPSVFLLDEVTSALDPQNERKVEESLSKIMKNKTVLTITHKLQNLKEKKRVCGVEAGKIVPPKPPQELKMTEIVVSEGKEIYYEHDE